MLAPPSGIEPSPPTLEGEGLTSGAPGRSLRESLSAEKFEGQIEKVTKYWGGGVGASL